MSSRQRAFRLTHAGWAMLPGALLLTLGAINSGLNLTYLLAGLAIAVFLAGVIAPLWNGRGVTCRREIPRPPHAGEPFDYTLIISSRRRTATRLVRVLDPLAGPDSRGIVIPSIPPKGTIRISRVGAPLRRGAHPMPPIEWRSGFPFGLAECGARLRDGGELLVYPARGLLARQPASAGKPAATRVGAPNVQGLLADDFRSLREYHPGDSLRRVHWRASAHHGELHVRELERERFAPTVILLDSRIPAGLSRGEDRSGASEPEQALELAVSFTAEVARRTLRQGGNVAIAGYFPQPALLVAGERGFSRFEMSPNDANQTDEEAIASILPVESSRRDSLDRVMEALARLKASEAATAAALAPLAAQAGAVPGARIIGVSLTPGTAQSLREVFPGRASEIYIASASAFSEVFRLLIRGEEA